MEYIEHQLHSIYNYSEILLWLDTLIVIIETDYIRYIDNKIQDSLSFKFNLLDLNTNLNNYNIDITQHTKFITESINNISKDKSTNKLPDNVILKILSFLTVSDLDNIYTNSKLFHISYRNKFIDYISKYNNNNEIYYTLYLDSNEMYYNNFSKFTTKNIIELLYLFIQYCKSCYINTKSIIDTDILELYNSVIYNNEVYRYNIIDKLKVNISKEQYTNIQLKKQYELLSNYKNTLAIKINSIEQDINNISDYIQDNIISYYTSKINLINEQINNTLINITNVKQYLTEQKNRLRIENKILVKEIKHNSDLFTEFYYYNKLLNTREEIFNIFSSINLNN